MLLEGSPEHWARQVLGLPDFPPSKTLTWKKLFATWAHSSWRWRRAQTSLLCDALLLVTLGHFTPGDQQPQEHQHDSMSGVTGQ